MFAKQMVDSGLLTLMFAGSKGNIAREFEKHSFASRLDTMDMTTDLSDTEAVEYCTCLSADVGEKDIKKVVEVVGGRFSDLRRACNCLTLFSVQSVLKVMYSTAHAELKRERRVRALLLASFNV